MARYTPGYWAYRGDFRRVNIREWFIENSDLMVLDNYDRYVGGNYALTYHRNAQAENPQTLLLIKDSFSMPVECFLSTEFAAVDVLDPRSYDRMSVMDYVSLNRPDLVIMLSYETTMELEDYQYFGEAKGLTVRGETLYRQAEADISGGAGVTDYLSVPLSLQPGQNCELTVSSIQAAAGNPDGVSVVLCRGTQQLDETAFDIDYGNLYGFHWGFQIPEAQDTAEDCELRLYAGIAGSTEGVRLHCQEIRVNSCVLPDPEPDPVDRPSSK